MRRLRFTDLQTARDLFKINHLVEEENKLWKRNTRWLGLWTVLRCRRAMFAGLITMVFQQYCGISVFAHYATPVFLGTIDNTKTNNSEARWKALKVCELDVAAHGTADDRHSWHSELEWSILCSPSRLSSQ